MGLSISGAIEVNRDSLMGGFIREKFCTIISLFIQFSHFLNFQVQLIFINVYPDVVAN